MIGQFQFAELQAISYAITREKAPIYTMGSADPRAYSRNKRGIAGNLIWINFDRHALLNLFHKAKGRYVADVDENRPSFSPASLEANAPFASSSVLNNGPSIGDTRSHRPAGHNTPRAHARAGPTTRRVLLLELTGSSRRRDFSAGRSFCRTKSPVSYDFQSSTRGYGTRSTNKWLLIFAIVSLH